MLKEERRQRDDSDHKRRVRCFSPERARTPSVGTGLSKEASDD